MEEPEVFNRTNGIMPLARPQSYPTPPFPAWLPAVTVAVSMLVFLAGSFYLRHRKVMKKRQILMDYFYIIFQYGGSRRKRMVTALCNTNAITLRELGRSFMISCESMPGNDNDNSCPFYLDDSDAKPPGHLRRPLTKKYSLLKRGFTITRRHRGPFLKMKTQSEENGRQYPYSFQDIVMKLGGRRHHTDSSRSRSANRHALTMPQFEGCSMSTIHGDEMEYNTPKENCRSSEFSNKQRRNAYILQYDKSIPRFADVAAEVGRHSLGHGAPDRLSAQHSPYPGKRNSEPWHNLYDPESQNQGLQPDVFHVQGSMLSPSNVVCGSHGYISSIDKESNAYQPYRNSEPTIMVHSPSIDADASQGWNDIRSRYTNGVVFLKRVSKEDGSPGEYYYEEERPPSADRPARSSLSKVSYVPSGNMNQYQNCIVSSNKDKSSKEEETQGKKPKGDNMSQGMSKSKRGRLNLGRLGVGTFSRRIDLASDSLQDYEPEHSAENKSSPDSASHQRTSPRTTWTRFKNVFSGSRDTQSVSLQAKPAACLSATEQQKTKTARERTNWQKFLSVFTGFRSFPEDKKEDELIDLPKSSNSVPSGLNLIGNNSDAKFIDMEAGMRMLPFEISNDPSPESSKHLTLSAASSFSDSENDNSVTNSSTVYQTDRQRPTSLNLNSRAQSFPDDIIHPRQYLQRFQKVFDAPGLIKNRPYLNRPINQKYIQVNNCFAPPAAPLSKWKRDFKSYSFEAGYCSPSGEYRFKRRPTFMDSSHAATPDRLEGNCSGSETSVCPRRFRSLSPLLEINCADSNKGAGTECTTNLQSLQSSSVYMTPIQDNGKSFGSEVKSCEEILNLDALTLDQEVLDYTSSNLQHQDFLPINANSEESDDEHTVNSDAFKYPNFPTIESDSLKSDYSDARLQPHTMFGSNGKLPQSCFLIPNQKIVSRSSDSVYYDTFSALGTPSPSDSKDMDFAKIPLIEHTWRNEDTGLINCIDNVLPVMPSSHDAIVSPNVLDMQTPATREPPIISSGHVPSSQQSRLLSNESLTSLDRQCNKLFCVLSTESYTTQGTDSAQVTTVDSLPKSPEPNIDFKSAQSAQLSLNERHHRSPLLPCSFDITQFESLPVPARNSSTNEHQNTSSESTPKSSRASTPTRRHSNPSPSPERSQCRQSGCYTPDELYMANVTRLPRLSKRLGHSGTMPSLCHVKYIHE